MRKKRKTKTTARPQRPSDVEIALKLRGSQGRCFAREGEAWLDTQTGARGSLAELAGAWTAEPEPVP